MKYLILVILIFVGCQKNDVPPAPVKTVSETVAVSAPVQIAPEVVKDWLAKLLQRSNQVEFRERNQNIWKHAETNFAFLKYDALQTKNSSTAEVIYQSGSTLDIKENTLIIFDEDPGQKKKTEDRVIIKSGQLTGKTKTELWVFTDSGLVQIKAQKGSGKKVAEAKVSVSKDRTVNIKVKSGTAEVVYKKEKDFARLAVAENAEATIKPATEALAVNDLVTAQASAPAVAQADLAVEFPTDNVLVQTNEIEVRGRITGSGAKLLINGQLTEVFADGSFSKKISLQSGTNLVVFQIIRSDATIKFVKRSVRYQSK